MKSTARVMRIALILVLGLLAAVACKEFVVFGDNFATDAVGQPPPAPWQTFVKGGGSVTVEVVPENGGTSNAAWVDATYPGAEAVLAYVDPRPMMRYVSASADLFATDADDPWEFYLGFARPSAAASPAVDPIAPAAEVVYQSGALYASTRDGQVKCAEMDRPETWINVGIVANNTLKQFDVIVDDAGTDCKDVPFLHAHRLNGFAIKARSGSVVWVDNVEVVEEPHDPGDEAPAT
jgi:hypothetical protein